jgi:TusA-related sulfurtransferase
MPQHLLEAAKLRELAMRYEKGEVLSVKVTCITLDGDIESHSLTANYVERYQQEAGLIGYAARQVLP